MDIRQRIYEAGIVPVIKIDHAEDAIPLASALCKGGLKVAEITFRTDAAEESIRQISKEVPDMLVGAGTVLTKEQVDRAKNAGASFLVSPGFNKEMVRYALSIDMPIIPGCSTPTAIEAALELGLTTLKFFPAEAAGGLNMIKALCAPYTTVEFMPTGGIGEDNLNNYLSYNRVVACGGSWMVKDKLIREGNFQEIELLTRRAIHKMLGFSLAGISIASNDAVISDKEAKLIATLFGNGSTDEINAYGEGVLSVNDAQNTHTIKIHTLSLDRACAYLSTLGYAFDDSTTCCTKQGKKDSICLKNDILGFKLQLISQS